jgi:hypothetical protein
VSSYYGLVEVEMIEDGAHVFNRMGMTVEHLIVWAVALPMPTHVPGKQPVGALERLDLLLPHAARSPKPMTEQNRLPTPMIFVVQLYLSAPQVWHHALLSS